MNQELIEVPAGVKVSDFPTGYGTRDEIIRHLIADRDAWKIVAKHNDTWNALPQSEKEAALQKALDDTTKESCERLDEIERLRNVLMDARDKLKIYYEHGDKSYEGGVPYNVLMSQIASIINEQ